jgi:hypothetical protein
MGKVVSTDEECYQIQCAVFDIYREMGCGFLEGGLSRMHGKGIIKARNSLCRAPTTVASLQGWEVAAKLYSRLVNHESIIVELKAQVLNYLKAT